MRLSARIRNRGAEFSGRKRCQLYMRTLCIVTLLLLAACSEKPQELSASMNPGWQTDNWRHELRDRGQTQNESNRIAY
jgi:hypothetical protein